MSVILQIHHAIYPVLLTIPIIEKQKHNVNVP